MKPFILLDAIIQNYASNKKRRRQLDNGTYEQYQKEQKMRQRIKRVRVPLVYMHNMLNKNIYMYIVVFLCKSHFLLEFPRENTLFCILHVVWQVKLLL